MDCKRINSDDFVVILRLAVPPQGFVALGFYVFGYAAGPGVCFWVMLTDVFPSHIAAQGASLINLQQWTENLILTFIFPVVVQYTDIAVGFFFFHVVALVCFGVLAKLLPKTVPVIATTQAVPNVVLIVQ